MISRDASEGVKKLGRLGGQEYLQDFTIAVF
jgi:hypothetical protein